MNILVTINDNYMIPLLIMLESLFRHEPGRMTIYLFYSNLSEKNKRRLHSFIQKRSGQFVPINVGENTFGDAPVCRYFPKEMYYRFLCSELLPGTADRVLYLDPDILIRGPVAPLYEMDFEGKLLIGIEDYAVNYIFTETKNALGLTEKDTYINTGVLLFNLKKMRAVFQIEDYIRLLDKYRNQLLFPDQDIMNIYFRGKIRYADPMYNYSSGYSRAAEMFLDFFRGKEKPVIVHYMGELKPWKADYYGKYFFEYYAYLKKYLKRKGRVRFFFRPCYAAVRMVKSWCKKIAADKR